MNHNAGDVLIAGYEPESDAQRYKEPRIINSKYEFRDRKCYTENSTRRKAIGKAMKRNGIREYPVTRNSRNQKAARDTTASKGSARIKKCIYHINLTLSHK